MDEHRTQRTFRKILEAMTFPGKIVQLEQSPNELSPLYSQTVLVCQTLLDGEVTFAVIGEKKVSQSIQAYTGSHEAKVEEADFIIIPNTVDSNEIADLKVAKKGDLLNPQKSATLFFEVDNLMDGIQLELMGPGIKDKTVIHADISKGFLKIRDELNAEYPLGIDVLFIDRSGYGMALPRTTKVTEVK
ncbi:phosphonate C-P lyase system protein PhnH [Ureibacillus sp. Re31]|uniref:Phosphonate C-P lyase system protein PhnH n=1 Tax=Ureibacillus galli TaxID=2762222 RepID=A0ABR8XCM2_9BACL|nr:phosphonate C-P lyase system protein PhnH [Ureibacillus galli]MBD8026968.1 phosphonate C-P lyase system protein PhnH [Ureibacillus galli]